MTREQEMIEMAKPIFAKYDQEIMIKRLELEHDEDYIYINILKDRYSLNRKTFDVFKENNELATHIEHLTIYEAICHHDERPLPSAKFFPINSLGNMVHPGVNPEQMYASYAPMFEENLEKIEEYFTSLGAEKYPVGDVAYVLPLFDFLKACVQIWKSDEEYPTVLQVLWEENTLSHLKYEVVWYACGVMLEKIKRKVADK